MAYTAQTLVSRSWYLSGIVARNLEAPTGDELTDGLMMLNALLDFKQVELDLLPYYTYDTSLVAVPNQEIYFIQNCALIQTVTFNIDVVRYPMDQTSAQRYFGSSRVDNIASLPFNWNFQRTLNGGNLYIYFLPAGEYPLKIYGKFFLTDVSAQTDLLTVYDTSYLEYLRYALAEYMCSEYGVTFNPQSAAILRKYERKLMYLSPPDFSGIKSSILTAGGPLNYGDVNIGKGWRP